MMLTGAFDVAKGQRHVHSTNKLWTAFLRQFEEMIKTPGRRPGARKPFNFRSKTSEPLWGVQTGRSPSLSYTELTEHSVQQLFIHLISGDFPQGALGGGQVYRG